MHDRYALIDESGRLYDSRDRILVFAVLTTKTLVGLDKIIPKVRNKIPRKGKRRREKLAEMKFSLAGDRTRRLVLEEIAKQRIMIYVLVIDKQGRKIKDNPKNYALLVFKNLEKALNENLKLEHILIDRHFTFVTQRERFNNLLQASFKREVFIEHLDSQQNSIISLADFVAGSVRRGYVHNDNKFRRLIDKMIKEEKLVTWRELKQKAANL